MEGRLQERRVVARYPAVISLLSMPAFPFHQWFLCPVDGRVLIASNSAGVVI